MKKNAITKNAFTLAEVLITIGIIGVVAALTIPNLINKYNNRITETRLQKFYSMFNQAIKLSTVEYGSPEGWDDYWTLSKNTMEDDKYISRYDNVKSVVDKYIASNMKILSVTKTSEDESRGNISTIIWELFDGSAFGYTDNHIRDIYFFPKNWQKCIKREFKDANGSCRFNFLFNPKATGDNWKYHSEHGLDANMYNWNGDIQNLYNDSYGCNPGGNGLYCTAIIQKNNWKIPKDYPRKIYY